MKYCTNCGAQLKDEDKFCIKCGARSEFIPNSESQTEGADIEGELLNMNQGDLEPEVVVAGGELVDNADLIDVADNNIAQNNGGAALGAGIDAGQDASAEQAADSCGSNDACDAQSDSANQSSGSGLKAAAFGAGIGAGIGAAAAGDDNDIENDIPKEGGRIAGMYNNLDGDEDGGAKGVDIAKKKPKFVKPWFIAGAIALIVIILVLGINLGSCGADTPDTSSTEQTTVQTEPEKPVVVKEQHLYLADMVGKPFSEIRDSYGLIYEKIVYDDEFDDGPAMVCTYGGSVSDTDGDYASMFVTSEAPANKESVCDIVISTDENVKVTKDLISDMTYDDLKKVAGELPKPQYDEEFGNYVIFDDKGLGLRFGYYWGFAGAKVEENAIDPMYEKSMGVYIVRSAAEDDSEAILKDYALNDAYYGWVDDTATMDEYLKDTMGVIYTIGEEKVPVLILRCDSALHYQGYTRAYKYVNGEVIEISIADNVAYLNFDTGLMETTYTGGGYGETESNYYHVDNDPNNAGPLSSSSEFREYDDEMGIGNHYWLGAMYDEGEMSKNEISKEEFDKLMKPYRKGSNVIDDFYGKMESQMETIAHWK